MYQDELTLGVERLLDPTFTVGVKATYRNLGNAVEERCDLDYSQNNSRCAVVNPGSSSRYARGDFYSCSGLDGSDCNAVDPVPIDGAPATPRARRIYRGIELLARKSFCNTLWLQASYVYSSLRGNYDGAVNETFQRPRPGSTPDFDYPAALAQRLRTPLPGPTQPFPPGRRTGRRPGGSR